MAHPCQILTLLGAAECGGRAERRVRWSADDDARRRRRRAPERRTERGSPPHGVWKHTDGRRDPTRVKVVRRRGQFIEGEAREASATSTTARDTHRARHATIAVDVQTFSLGVRFTHRVPVAVEDCGGGGAVGPASAVGRAAVLLDQVGAGHVPLVLRQSIAVHRAPRPGGRCARPPAQHAGAVKQELHAVWVTSGLAAGREVEWRAETGAASAQLVGRRIVRFEGGGTRAFAARRRLSSSPPGTRPSRPCCPGSLACRRTRGGGGAAWRWSRGLVRTPR